MVLSKLQCNTCSVFLRVKILLIFVLKLKNSFITQYNRRLVGRRMKGYGFN